MDIREYSRFRLEEFGISPDVINLYDEPHRFYHNWDHIASMIDNARTLGIMVDELFLAIIFHDIIYDPKSTTNEEDSVEFFKKHYDNDVVCQAILDTKTHEPRSLTSKILCKLDLGVLYDDLSDFMAFEDKIFKEYQFVDYSLYKVGRTEILINLNVCQEFLDYVGNRKPKIGVYAGSFNPFHKGHLNILRKAERIFDKVIIARGKNPDKSNEMSELPEVLKYHQCVEYDGLLTDFIDSLDYDVTLIRGLRNSTDLQFEFTQYRFLQELKPDIDVVSIFCDKEYEHISSSAIRQLKVFGKADNYLL